MARLLGDLLDPGWRKQLVYGLITILILTDLFYTLSLSTPLFRFYFFAAALLSLVFCLRWTIKNARGGDAPRYVWGFGMAAVLCAVVVYTEVWGEAERAEYLFTSSVKTLVFLLGLWLLNRRIKETIGIRYDDVSKMAVIVQDVEQMLRAHPEIDTSRTLMVNFTTFAPSSLDFFIYTFTKTCPWRIVTQAATGSWNRPPQCVLK